MLWLRDSFEKRKKTTKCLLIVWYYAVLFVYGFLFENVINIDFLERLARIYKSYEQEISWRKQSKIYFV